MKKNFALLICISFLFSCTSNTIYEKPKDLIPRDTMVLLLKDLYLASAAKNIKNNKQRRKISYLPLVYNLYKIDSLRFQNSSLYYTSKIDEYQPMLQEALSLLENERTSLSKIKKAQDSIRQDSIKKSRAALLKSKGKELNPENVKKKKDFERMKKEKARKKN
jgi:hypothetical protein